MPSKRTNDMTLKAESQSTEGGSDSEDLDQLEGEAGASPTMQSSPRRARHLAQGQACLKCRTRKTKCDAKQPICSPCIRLKRECVYEGYERARTLRLLSRIESLEGQLDKLQERSSASSQLSPSGSHQDDRLASEQSGSSRKVLDRSTTDIKPTGSALSQIALHLHNTLHESPESEERWWLADMPPQPIQKRLLDIVITLRGGYSFYFHAERFRDSMSPSYTGSPPLPALLNAMYLVGCHLLEEPEFALVEPHYLTRTRRMLSDSLGDPSVHLLQWLQAACLLTYYLWRKCRFLEARQELAGVVQLITSSGLHKIRSSDWKAQDAVLSTSLLPPPKDNIELGERICLFWMAYQYDHITSLVCGLAPNPHFDSEMETVWPRSYEEYEQGVWKTPDASISSLFGPEPAHPFDPPCTMHALRCKAIALLTRISVFATSCTPAYVQTPEFNARFAEYHRVVGAFLDRMPPLTYDPTTVDVPIAPLPAINVGVLVSQQILALAHILLYNAVDLMSGGFSELYEKRLNMAKRCISVVRAFMGAKISIKDPGIIGAYFWFPVARVFAQHIRRLRSSEMPSDAESAELEETQRDMAAILDCVELYKTLPITQLQLDKLSAYIDGTDDHLTPNVGPSSPVSTISP